VQFSNSEKTFLDIRLGNFDSHNRLLILDENNNVIDRARFRDHFVGKFMEEHFTNPEITEDIIKSTSLQNEFCEKLSKRAEPDVINIDAYRFGLFDHDGTKSFVTFILLRYKHECDEWCGFDCDDGYTINNEIGSDFKDHIWQWKKEIPD
jgi:hypothetical protein